MLDFGDFVMTSLHQCPAAGPQVNVPIGLGVGQPPGAPMTKLVHGKIFDKDGLRHFTIESSDETCYGTGPVLVCEAESITQRPAHS